MPRQRRFGASFSNPFRNDSVSSRRGSLPWVAIAVAVLVATGMSHRTEATCAVPYRIQSDGYVQIIDSVNNAVYQDLPNLTNGAEGVFWMLGYGDPVMGAGNDNGSFLLSDWIQGYLAYPMGGGLWYNLYVVLDTHWAASPAIDGCPTAVAPLGDACTCLMISDQEEGIGYFTLQGDQASACCPFLRPTGIRSGEVSGEPR